MRKMVYNFFFFFTLGYVSRTRKIMIWFYLLGFSKRRKQNEVKLSDGKGQGYYRKKLPLPEGEKS